MPHNSSSTFGSLKERQNKGAKTSTRLAEKESRAHGQTWVLFFRTSRKSDSKRVEAKIPIGLVKDFPEKSDTWAEIDRLHLPSIR